MKRRIANNKNIQTMEQKDIDIYEILKDMPSYTELYTPLSGKVGLSYMALNKEAGEAILVKNKNGEYSFNKNGRWMEGGEILLFPSNKMRDWSKFFKKGDVLEYKKENNQATCLFDSYEDDTTKLRFTGLYTLTKGKIWDTPTIWDISDWVKSDNPAAYIKTIEERLGGKLNRETLEIEKSAKPTFEIGKLYVFNEDDEDGELTIIGKLIDKNESEDTLTFGNQYEIETEKFVTDQAFDLRISVNKELREATENEVELFNKHYAIWKKEKEAKEQPAFKTFDKVLVRDGKEYEWLPALFVRDRGEGANYRYKVLSLRSGKPAEFACCIPYEGNENIIFTDHNIDNLTF